MEYKLSKPIQHGDEEITHLVLREPTIKDLRYSEDSHGGFNDIKLIESVAGQPPSVINQVPARDFFALREALAPFFMPSPVTGEESPPAL